MPPSVLSQLHQPGKPRRNCHHTKRPTRGPDHPRSRGVYLALAPTEVTAAGSSPLARGLPLGHDADPSAEGSSPLARGLRRLWRLRQVRLRIIPARAGFTGSHLLGDGLTADHPRSRGVYVRCADPWEPPLGSSPLARGLRQFHHHNRVRRRIIPARAGFTRPSTTPAEASGDHPRSRGVYPKHGWVQAMQAGSSPLARGLRVQ